MLEVAAIPSIQDLARMISTQSTITSRSPLLSQILASSPGRLSMSTTHSMFINAFYDPLPHDSQVAEVTYHRPYDTKDSELLQHVVFKIPGLSQEKEAKQ